MANGLFLKGTSERGKGNIDWENDTIKLIWLDPTHTFDFVNDAFLSDISADRATNTTDQTLTNAAVTEDGANTRVEFDADNVSQSSLTTDTDKFALYKYTGNAATSPLICGIEFTEGTLSPVNGTLTVTVNAEGFFSIST